MFESCRAHLRSTVRPPPAAGRRSPRHGSRAGRGSRSRRTWSSAQRRHRHGVDGPATWSRTRAERSSTRSRSEPTSGPATSTRPPRHDERPDLEPCRGRGGCCGAARPSRRGRSSAIAGATAPSEPRARSRSAPGRRTWQAVRPRPPRRRARPRSGKHGADDHRYARTGPTGRSARSRPVPASSRPGRDRSQAV